MDEGRMRTRTNALLMLTTLTLAAAAAADEGGDPDKNGPKKGGRKATSADAAARFAQPRKGWMVGWLDGWMGEWECRNSRIEIRCCSSSSLLPLGDAAIARASHPDPSLSPIGFDVSKGAIDGAMLRPGPEERNRCQRSSSRRCLVGIPISSIVVAVSIQGCFAIVYSSPRESARPAGK